MAENQHLTEEKAEITLSSFLEQHELFKGINEEEKAFLASVCDLKKIKKGNFFIKAGEDSSDICLIVKGSVEILVRSDTSGEEIPVKTITSGGTIGELSFIDGSPRSASVRTLENTEFILVPRAPFKETTDLITGLLSKIHYNIAVLSSSRLKKTSSEFVESMQRELNLLKEQVQFGELFVYMIILFGVNGFVLDVISKHFGKYYFLKDPVTMEWNIHFNLIAERAIAWVGALVIGIPVILLIRKIKFPIMEILDIRKNFRKSVSESLAISLIFAGTAILLSCGPIIIPGFARMKELPSLYFLMVIIVPDYLFHSYFQEAMSRGIMQNAIQRFLRDERGHKTVWVSSFAFGVMHSHLGVKMVLASTFASAGFGYIYLRQKNLVGVTIIHYVIGVIGRYLKVIGLI